MENKLVFEPTVLTQYSWNKYNLLTTYTYYWQVHQAIADYMTQYTWSKNEVLPDDVPSWDRYTIESDYALKYYWQVYNTTNLPLYFYRKMLCETQNNYTFKWRAARTYYKYNYNMVAANHIYKYPVKKYAAKNSETPQTYYYHEKYFAFKKNGTGMENEIFLYYPPIYPDTYQITKTGNMIESMTPQGTSNSKVKLYGIGDYYGSWCGFRNGQPNTEDITYHQYYPYGSTDIESNTSGCYSIIKWMKQQRRLSGSSQGKNQNIWIKDTDGNNYIFTPYTYYDWDDGKVHNVVPVSVVNKDAGSQGYLSIDTLPDRSLSSNIEPNPNFAAYTPGMPDGASPPSQWPGYIVRNNSDNNLPAVPFTEDAAPNGWKFINNVKYIGYSNSIQHKIYNDDNTWNNSSFLYWPTMNFIYKIETINKEKDGNDYILDYIYSHIDTNTGLQQYYDSDEDKWIEIDFSNGVDTAVDWKKAFWTPLSIIYDNVSVLTPYQEGQIAYNSTPYTHVVVSSYASEGWVDDTPTTITRQISVKSDVSPQPKSTDYFPDDGRPGDGVHYVLISSQMVESYPATGTIYGEEISSKTQKDTVETLFENGNPYRWHLTRIGSYEGQGSTLLWTIGSWNRNEYPDNGARNGNWYVYTTRQSEPTGTYSRGTFVDEVVSSTPNKYPQDGIQDGYWYVYYGTVNTEYKYVYQKPVQFDIYKSYWYAKVPNGMIVDRLEYVDDNNQHPTEFLGFATDAFLNNDDFFDTGFYLSIPTNFSGWLKYNRKLGTLPSSYRDRYFLVENWYCLYAIPHNVEVEYQNSASSVLYDDTYLYDMKYFRDKILKKYGGFILMPHIDGHTPAEYEESFIAGTNGLQYAYILGNHPEIGDGTYIGYETRTPLNISTPYFRNLVSTNQTYTGYPDKKYYSYRGSNDANYLNAGFHYIGIEENTNPDYRYQLIEEIQSYVPNEYPDGEIAADGFYYEIINTEDIIVGYHKGEFLYNTSSDDGNAYPHNNVDMNGLYYSFLRTDTHYARGTLIETVYSYIENAYPNDNYIVNDAWYMFIESREFIVGELTIDKSQLMGGVNYTQEINPSEDLMIGAGGAAQVDFTIYTPDANAATQYLGKDFTYYVKMPHDSDWRQVGVFTLTKAELPDKQTAKIEGFDYIYKFDTVIDGWLDSLTFPMTLGQLFNSLCEYVGCEAYSTEFNNSTFIVNDNFEAIQITGRTILQYITEVSGGFCVAEPDGRIHIKQYSIPPTGTINLGNDSYVKYTHEIYNVPVITSVVVRKDDEDEGVESNV